MTNTWKMIFKTMPKISKFLKRNLYQLINPKLSKLRLDLTLRNKCSSTFKKYLKRSKNQNQDERRQPLHLLRKNKTNILKNKKLFPRRKSSNPQNLNLKSDHCQTMIERRVDLTLRIRCNDLLQNQSRNLLWSKIALSRQTKITFLRSR